MMGTGPFAVPTFRQLYETHHQIVALVTAPVRTHRGKPVAPVSNIRDIALEHGTEVYDPESINTPQSQRHLAELAPDLLVVCDYGQILAAPTLATARLGGINLHGSLLPRYRGAAPINWAVYHGEEETGVTVIHMTPQVDAGPCIAQANTPIGPDETADQLEGRLSEMGAWLVVRAIDAVESGRLEALPQNPALACKAPRLKKSDGELDWTRPALAIKDHIRAMHPWPKTFTYWHRAGGSPVRLILGPVTVVERSEGAAEVVPGTVLRAEEDQLVVAAGEKAVAIRSVQPAGKKLLNTEQFLRGYHVQPGDLLGPEKKTGQV